MHIGLKRDHYRCKKNCIDANQMSLFCCVLTSSPFHQVTIIWSLENLFPRSLLFSSKWCNVPTYYSIYINLLASGTPGWSAMQPFHQDKICFMSSEVCHISPFFSFANIATWWSFEFLHVRTRSDMNRLCCERRGHVTSLTLDRSIYTYLYILKAH